VEKPSKRACCPRGKGSQPGQNQKGHVKRPLQGAQAQEQAAGSAVSSMGTNRARLAFDQMEEEGSSTEARSEAGCRTGRSRSRSSVRLWRGGSGRGRRKLAAFEKSPGRGPSALPLLSATPHPGFSNGSKVAESECRTRGTQALRSTSSEPGSPLLIPLRLSGIIYNRRHLIQPRGCSPSSRFSFQLDVLEGQPDTVLVELLGLPGCWPLPPDPLP